MIYNMDSLQTLLSVALDLTAALTTGDRYGRLLEALGRVIPYDASALLRIDGDALVPVEARGLSEDALGRRFLLKEHPRLEIISRSSEPVRFPADTELPDPFDGLLAEAGGEFQPIHACLGCPLRVEGELIGALTADALDPDAFEGIDQDFLSAVGALAAAEMRTAELLEALEKSAARQGMIARDLMRDARMREGTQIVGTSPVMVRLRREAELVARSDFTVLITGETGTGKELVARAVHDASPRREEALIHVNCAALPETLADSELFGHVRGSFTGATSDRPGKFEVADGGTLLLDEIGELPLSVQPKLLRALQEGEIQRVGTETPIRVDVRVLAATNRDLERAVRAGEFRADLYHRLDVYPLRVPPLRERMNDIPLLAGYFCDLIRRRLGAGPVRLDPEALDALQRYPWPGNVRELENVLSRAALKAAARVTPGQPVVLGPRHFGMEFFDGAGTGAAGRLGAEAGAGGRLEAETGAGGTRADMGSGVGGWGVAAEGASDGRTGVQGLSRGGGGGAGRDAPLPHLSLRAAVESFKRELIFQALEENNGNWAAAARSLGLHRSNLHHLARRLGLK